MGHISTHGIAIFAATFVVAVFVFISGRALVGFVFRPLRRIATFLGRRLLAPLYRVTLRPLVRLVRRVFGLASTISTPAHQGAQLGSGSAPYKALVNLLERNSLAEIALGEVPKSIRSLLDRKGIFFRSVNANRAVLRVHDSLSDEEARANVQLAEVYYRKPIDDAVLSPTLLYEDTEEALVIDILRDADMTFFWVLRRIKRNVSRNLIKVMVLLTALVAAFPFLLTILLAVATRYASLPDDTSGNNTRWLIGIASFPVFGLALWQLRNTYANSARYNGQNFNHFVQTYFSRLLNQYKSASAAFSNILNDRSERLSEIEDEAGIWFINMHWLSARKWLLELDVRNIMFQIRRDLLWFTLFLLPSMIAFWAMVYLLIIKINWDLWIVVPFLALLVGYLYSLNDLLHRFWYELATGVWPSFRDMDILTTIKKNVGSLAKEVVDRRRNPYGTQQQPIGRP